MKQSPMAAAQMMIALGIQRGPTREIVFVGDPASLELAEALKLLRESFIPDKVVAYLRSGDAESEGSPIKLLVGKKATGSGFTTYICQNFTCQEPLVGLKPLKIALKSAI